MVWNYLSISKLQQCSCWSLGNDNQFHPTFYNGCNYLLGLKLIHVRKRGNWPPFCFVLITWRSLSWFHQIIHSLFPRLRYLWWIRITPVHIDDLEQECSNSSALAMESLQSCTKSPNDMIMHMTPLVFGRGIHKSTMVSLNKLWNKQYSGQQCEMSWCNFGKTIMQCALLMQTKFIKITCLEISLPYVLWRAKRSI